MFGTFRDKLKETGPSTYRGGSEEKVDTKTASAHDAKASLTTPPDFVVTTGIKQSSNIGSALVSAMYGRSSELGLST